ILGRSSGAGNPLQAVTALKLTYGAGGIANSVVLPAASPADLRPRRAGEPLQIGFNRDIPTDLAPSLAPERWVWTRAGEGAVTALSVRSPGAVALRLALDVRTLPAGAELRFFGGDSNAEVIGPFTTSDVLAQIAAPDGGRRFWSPIVAGDTISVELFVPADRD